MIADYQIHGAVAVITINNPPMNVLSLAVRKAIVENLERAIADAAIKAVVITGAGAAFSAGADIREFDTREAVTEPHLHTVIRAVEESPKPVIAAIHSVCMGAGVELALGCHYRLAACGTVLAQPEVKLGLSPGAGATQRLPRLVGLETALNMIISGEPVKSEHLSQTRMFDRLVAGDLIKETIDFAEKISNERQIPPKVRDLKVDYPNYEAFLSFARNSIKSAAVNYPAPLRCVDAIQAAITMDFDAGIQQELDIFFELMATRQSKALIHVFFAEKASSKIPDVPEDTPVRPIRKAAIIGAGTMGSGIAMNFMNAGIPITILELDQAPLDRGIAKIRATYEDSLKKGRLSRQDLENRNKLLSTTLDYAAIADADIVIEAVFEDLSVKKGVFEKLDATMKPGAILATNTSTLDVNKIAQFTRRPQDVLGAHFFSPANVMKLLEVVRGEATAKDVLATVMKLARKLKKTGVLSGVCDGFIGNRMMEQYARQAEFLLEEGCTPEQIDGAVEKFGFAMGPFRVSDLAGNDIIVHIRNRQRYEKPKVRYSRLPELLYERKRLGQKSGAGWYDYVPGSRQARTAPAVNEMIRKHRESLGIAARHVADREIVERLVFALVNEGARILEEGIALRASDIDIVYLMGYGFPPWRGGPLFYADSIGLYSVLGSMRHFAGNPNADPEFWKPAPLLVRLAGEGNRFSSAKEKG